ncbi:MAG: pantoate--beta-alanine ligase [Acidobacteria bacterium]|nr:pantoate--beta-alanine ligase [Acidobacteriota bacterium]MDW7984690.1 pantoate--beta-alanine ligase [Acidobacteriota bacterium]
MEIVRRILRMKEIVRGWHRQGRTIGFVPTMGYLHEGHLSLIRESKRMTDHTVVSIFVNPLQFGPREDYDRYPRDLDRDVEILSRESVDVLFYPSVEDMYPPGYRTYIDVEGLSQKWEGASRPGHFRGVATVVCKLFHIVQPDFAFFGQKDAQQFVILRRMVQDLNMDVELIQLPIVRESDGLAMSSRNVYLSPEERTVAPRLYQALQVGRRLVQEEGERDAEKIVEAVRSFLAQEPRIRIDYVALVDLEDLEPIETVRGPALLAAAIYLGPTRLIDNVTLNTK